MAARLRRAHHRNAGILVGLEVIERIEDEGELHVRSSFPRAGIQPDRMHGFPLSRE
jgi:hypothetical protein